MRRAFRLAGWSLGDVWFNVTGYIECNLPVALVLLLGPSAVAQLDGLGVPAALVRLLQVGVIVCAGGPLLLGLNAVAREVAPYNERPDVRMLLRGARSRLQQGFAYGSILTCCVLAGTGAVVFYASVPHVWALFPLVLAFVILLFLFAVALYTPPFLIRSDAGLATALRNSAISALRYPALTWTLVAVSILVLLVSAVFVPLLLLVTFSLLTVLWTRAVGEVLRMEGLTSPPEPEEATPTLGD